MTVEAFRFVAVIGTLDTKGPEIAFLLDSLRALDLETKLVDVGVLGDPQIDADVTREAVAAQAGSSIRELCADTRDKVKAVTTMGRGAISILEEWLAEDRLAGVISLGGGVGTWVATTVMRSLPLGLPKIVVSTLPFDIRPHLGARDIVVFPSVADVLGLNPPLRTILRQAAAALAGMAAVPLPAATGRPLIGMTGMGVTTPAVLAAREILESDGYEVASFHATGLGGKAFEEWVGMGMFPAVLDLTTHELTDDLFGGTGATGDVRLENATRMGLPQVVAPGGLDIISRGPVETLSRTERKRPHYRHSPFFTHVRVPESGMRRVASRLAGKLNQGDGPIVVAIPLKGFSDQARAGGQIHDPEADAAFSETLKSKARKNIRIVEIDAHINDREFAVCICHLLKDVTKI